MVQLFQKARRVRGRRRLSVLAIFRNEGHILAEWLDHYIQFGVEHFYLINNRSRDDFSAVLAPYQAAGLVDLFDCEEDGAQTAAYTALLPLLIEETEWVGVFDLDEFIYPTREPSFLDIVERFPDHSAILAPWLSFGSNGYIRQPASAVRAFTRRGHAGVSRAFLKAFSRPGEILYFSQHNPLTKGPKVLSSGDDAGDELYINLCERDVGRFSLINNHYRLQSREYFETVKTARPEVNEAVAGDCKKLSFFEENDSAWNEIEDARLAGLHRMAQLGRGPATPIARFAGRLTQSYVAAGDGL